MKHPALIPIRHILDVEGKTRTLYLATVKNYDPNFGRITPGKRDETLRRNPPKNPRSRYANTKTTLERVYDACERRCLAGSHSFTNPEIEEETQISAVSGLITQLVRAERLIRAGASSRNRLIYLPSQRDQIPTGADGAVIKDESDRVRRTCLKCRGDFVAEGNCQRLCDSCRSANRQYSPMAEGI